MKKRLLIIPTVIAVAAVVLASVVFTRQEQFDDDTDREDSTPVTIEDITDEEPANWPELFKQYGNLRGGNFNRSYMNSAYYFLWEDYYSGFVVIHKDTHTMENPCQDVFCTHLDENCILGGKNEWCFESAGIIGNRIYFLYEGNFEKYRLISTDFSLNDVRIEWEESRSLGKMQADRDRLYFLETVYDEETGEALRTTVSWYSPSEKTNGFVKENLDIRDYIVYDGVLYAKTELNRLVRCDIYDPTPETILEVERGKNISMEYVDGNYLVFCVVTGFTLSDNQRLDLDTLQVIDYYDVYPQGYPYIVAQTFGDSNFLCIDHSGEPNMDDLYYDFYTDTEVQEMSRQFSLTAGRVYRLNDEGELVELAQLTTDGVPDMISRILEYDGRFLYVMYGTYRGFRNELNPDSDKRRPEFTNIAMIDTQTGQVYKLTETSGE